MRLIILGAGQYGMVAKETAEAMGTFDFIDFLDDNSNLAIGKIEDLEHIEFDAAFVAIGNPDVREKLTKQIGDKAAILIHTSATVMPTAQIGKGSIIEAEAVVCSNVVVGEASIIMSNAVIGHDASVGKCCQIKYNSSISEQSVVPDKVKVDCNTVWTYGV